MNETEKSSQSRRWALLIALCFGVLGGAGADALVSLRNSGAARVSAQAPVPGVTTAPLAPATQVLSSAVPEAAACSCVDGAEQQVARSPLAPRRKHGAKAAPAAKSGTSVCAATATLEQ